MTAAWRNLDPCSDAILSAHGGDQAVAVRPAIVRACGGDGNAAIFLSQLLYWAKRATNPDGWFYNTALQLEQQTGLGKRAQATARKNLKALGVLEDKVKDVPPVVHFRLDLALIASLVTEAQSSLQGENQSDRMRVIQFDRMRENQFPLQRGEQSDRMGGNPIQRLSKTPEETIDTGSPPSSEGMAQGQSSGGGQKKPLTPTPSPAALDRAEARMFDAGPSLDRQSKNDNNGWVGRPSEILRELKATINTRWREIKPDRVTPEKLDSIPEHVAPDQVDTFLEKTAAYLQTVDHPKYLKGLDTWLRQWHDWEDTSPPILPVPQSMASLMAKKMTGQNMRKPKSDANLG